MHLVLKFHVHRVLLCIQGYTRLLYNNPERKGLLLKESINIVISS